MSDEMNVKFLRHIIDTLKEIHSMGHVIDFGLIRRVNEDYSNALEKMKKDGSIGENE